MVQEVFGSLGIKNINGLACRIETMIDWFYNIEGNEPSSRKKIPETVIDLRLNDLVDRRNQVAHAGRDQSELLGTDEMQERLNFLKAYACSLFNVLANIYLDCYYIKSGVGISLGKPIEGPFKKKEGLVVVVRKPPCRIFRGQPIIGVRKKHVDRWGEILEIQVNDFAEESIETDSTTTIAGLRTNFKLTKGVELYALEKKDEVVWG